MPDAENIQNDLATWDSRVVAEQAKQKRPVQVLAGGSKPADEKTALSASCPTDGVQYGVDVYETPKGWGYVTFAEAEKDGRKYRKQVAHGPGGKTHDWELMEGGIDG